MQTKRIYYACLLAVSVWAPFTVLARPSEYKVGKPIVEKISDTSEVTLYATRRLLKSDFEVSVIENSCNQRVGAKCHYTFASIITFLQWKWSKNSDRSRIGKVPYSSNYKEYAEDRNEEMGLYPQSRAKIPNLPFHHLSCSDYSWLPDGGQSESLKLLRVSGERSMPNFQLGGVDQTQIESNHFDITATKDATGYRLLGNPKMAKFSAFPQSLVANSSRTSIVVENIDGETCEIVISPKEAVNDLRFDQIRDLRDQLRDQGTLYLYGSSFSGEMANKDATDPGSYINGLIDGLMRGEYK